MTHEAVKLTVGRIVHYVLAEHDAKHRSVFNDAGNPMRAGDIVPAIVVWPHTNVDQSFNGQAILDGNDSLWLASVPYGANNEPGTWHWPPRE